MAKGIPAGDGARLDYVTLRFIDDPASERAFLDDYYRRSINQMRIAIVLAIAITAAFGFRDVWITPTVTARLWFVRYAIMCPFFLAALLFSFTRHAKRFMQLCISLGMLVCGLGVIAMLVIAPAPGNNLYYAGLLLIPLFPPTIRVRFIYSTAASWTIIAAYEIAALRLTETSLPYLINNNFFLLTSAAIGMITSYMLELYARKNFIQQIQLEEGTRPVGAAAAEHPSRLHRPTGSRKNTRPSPTDLPRPPSFSRILRGSRGWPHPGRRARSSTC